MVDAGGVYLLFQGLSTFAIEKDLPVELGTHHCLEVNKLIRFSWVRFFCLFLGTHFKQPGFHAKMTSRDKKPPTISLFSFQFHMWWVFEKITRAFGCNLLKSGESLKSSSLPTLEVDFRPSQVCKAIWICSQPLGAASAGTCDGDRGFYNPKRRQVSGLQWKYWACLFHQGLLQECLYTSCSNTPGSWRGSSIFGWSLAIKSTGSRQSPWNHVSWKSCRVSTHKSRPPRKIHEFL